MGAFYSKQGDNIYSDDDRVTHIYFLSKGQAGFVLPSFGNACYIKIHKGDTFGVMDIIASSQIMMADEEKED